MSAFLIVLLSIIAVAIGVVSYYFSTRALALRERRRVSKSLATTQAILTALDHVPNALVSRDLRRGLVLILNHHAGILTELQPEHPHLYYLQTRTHKLNRLPTGFERGRLRCKSDRKQASIALESLAELIGKSGREKVIGLKNADLAAAAARMAAQQIAVENARQAAKDAENIRAYKQALNFAYQAQSLCKKLPPLMAGALTEAVSADVERLETLTGRTAKI